MLIIDANKTFFCLICVVEDMYESVNDREIRQVFEGQNRIHLEIKQLHHQLAVILDEQRRYVSVATDEISKRQGESGGQVGQVGRPRAHMHTNTLVKERTHIQ